MTRRSIPAAMAVLMLLPAAARAQRDFHWERALPAGNEVEIHNITGDIKVRPSTSGKVEVVGIHRGNRGDVRADVQQTSRGIIVCVLYDDRDTSCNDRGSNNRRNNGDRNWDNDHLDLEVAVPTNLVVSASNVSGNVDITGAQGDVSASVVSGDIRLQRLRATSVSAHSVSGEIEVQVDALTGRGDLSFRSVSGDITLELPRQLDADLSMTTVSGGLDSDYPITLGNGRMSRRRIEARVGSGGRHLDLNTVSGDVKLKAGR